MAELDDEDACCDYPAVHFYGAAQNADVATAEIALGYGILCQKTTKVALTALFPDCRYKYPF